MPEVKAIPDGFPRLSPYLCVDGAAAAIDFYTSVLGGAERVRMPMADGRIGHAEIGVGDAVIMLADPSPDPAVRDPRSLGGTPVTMSLYVEDADAVFARALAAGATGVRPVEMQFYGDRAGVFEDPFGHRWHITTHVEDVPEEEMRRRAREAMAGPG